MIRNNFLKKLLQSKLIRKEELSEIPVNILIFPMDWDNTMNTISAFYQPKEMMELEMSMDDYFAQFNEYRALLSDWRTVGIDNHEIGTLLKIFHKLEIESEEFSDSFNQHKKSLSKVNEVFMHHKDQLGSVAGGTKSSLRYQE